MENKLPYINLSEELYLNLAVVLILIDNLAKTKRNKYSLTFEKLQVFYYLANKPLYLQRILEIAAKPSLSLREEEYYSINSISFNVDDLFDRERLRGLLQNISAKGLLKASHEKGAGFCFHLTEQGNELSRHLKSSYLDDIRNYAGSMKSLLSQPASKLNSYLSRLFVEES